MMYAAELNSDSKGLWPARGFPPDYEEVRHLIRTHYQLQQGAFISAWHQEENWIRIHSEVSSIPMWNHAAWLGASPDGLNTFLNQTRTAWPYPDRAPAVYLVGTGEHEAEFAPRLVENGFEKCDQESWMIYAKPYAPPIAVKLEVRLGQTEEALSDFVQVFCAAYHAPVGPYQKLFQKGKPHADGGKTRHYVGYADGAAVCVASLITMDGQACIYNVGTLPSARKQGHAAQLLARIIADCQEREYRPLFLQAETGSGAERLYVRLGFQVGFVRTGYRLAEWRPPSRPQHSAVTAKRPTAPRYLSAIRKDVYPIAAKPSFLVHRVALPPGLDEEVQDFCTRSGIQPAALWTGAWTILLSRYSGEEKVCFGLQRPTPTRSVWQQVPSLVWVEVLEDKQVLAWLRGLNDALSSANLSREKGTLIESEFEPSSVESVLAPMSSRWGEHDLKIEPTHSLECRLDGSGSIDLIFDQHAFDAASLGRLAEHLFTLASGLIHRPGQLLASVEMLTSAEREQLLHKWNTAEEYADEFEPVSRLIEATAAHTPGASALVLATSGAGSGNDTALTYDELNRRANQLAHHLRQHGVGPEKVVGLCLDRGLDAIVGLLATVKAGGVCLPLDAAYPAERLEFMLSDSRAAVVLTQERLTRHLPPSTARLIAVDQSASAIECQPDMNLALSFEPDQAAYIIYTSGSTGKPKGVVITHRALSSHCLQCQREYEIQPSDRVLQFNSFSFDAAMEQVFSTLSSGATLVLRGPEVWTAAELGRRLTEAAVTVVDLPTGYWHQALVEWSSQAELVPRPLPRLFIVGGEAMSPESLRLWRGLPMVGVRLINAYGPTEATITATAFEVTPELLSARLPQRVPIGRPRGERTAYVLDRRTRLVPIGVSGELHLGGPLLARGYLNQPELTQRKFVANPFGRPGERLYKTGDLVRYLPDGNIEFQGRLDDQVKVRGYRIELGEIEAVLQQHPGLKENAVVLRDGSTRHPQLAAYVVSKNGRVPAARELRDYLKARLPEYMLPAAFVCLEAMPTLPGGKVNRGALRDLPPPLESAAPAVTGPRDPVELRVQLLFERILQRSPIGVDVSFFELGGDSLQALELIVELERISERSLPLETLYQAPSVEGLVRLLEHHSAFREGSSLVPLQTRGQRPPLFLVHTTPGDVLGYGNLIYHLDRDQACYGFQSLGLIRRELSHTRVEEMARYYVAQLAQVQARGPYFLGGWCYGGIVAVEMAQQLITAGETVAFLGLLETVAPPPSWRVHQYYLHRFKRLLHMSPSQWLRYTQAKAKYFRDVRLANKMRFRRLEKTESPGVASLEAHNRRLDQLEHVYNTNLAALTQYVPHPYPGRVTLFNATDVDVGVIPDPLYAWPGLAAEIEVHYVPGDHDSMLSEPNVAVLARKLQECLQRAQSRAGQDRALAENRPDRPAFEVQTI